VSLKASLSGSICGTPCPSFNPYSFGCVAESFTLSIDKNKEISFNPYSFGCVAESGRKKMSLYVILDVSILILLDVSLKVRSDLF